VIADVLQWHKQYPQDWKKVWQLVEDKWDNSGPCPNGALMPFNIDAKLNGAYIVLGCCTASATSARPSRSQRAPGRIRTAIPQAQREKAAFQRWRIRSSITPTTRSMPSLQALRSAR
jgi:hypothetical protein